LRGSEAGICREGRYLVIPARGASLPARCVVCNQATDRRAQRKLYWHPSGYYLLILISVVIYVIVAVIVRKRAYFELGICEQHAIRRRLGLWLGWLGTPVCLIGLFVANAADIKSTLLYTMLALGFAACPFTGFALARVVSAKRIDESQAWLVVGQAFLDSF
jgi:hypothetical protein